MFLGNEEQSENGNREKVNGSHNQPALVSNKYQGILVLFFNKVVACTLRNEH